MKRRDFHKISLGTGAVLGAFGVRAKSVLGANDRINLGIIGVGRRAQDLIKDFQKTQGAEFIAISDLNEPRMDQVAQGKNWRKYKDFRQLLEQKDVNAVLVVTPDHWHALNSIYSCMAGKHVYCEKPMTLTIAEGRAMVNAARKYKTVVQCGSQQRSMAACRIGCELVRNEYIGKITEAHASNYPSPWDQPFPAQPVPAGLDWDTWLGPAPERAYHPDIYTPRANPGWISLTPYSGGEVTGWGAHGLDIIQWALGMDETGPVEIWTDANTRILSRAVTMRYANGVIVKIDGQGPEGGGLFIGEKGSIMVDRGIYKIQPDELAKQPLPEMKTKLEISSNHQQNWLDCIRSGKRSIADVETGHRSTTMCHLVNIARWTGRKLQWDPQKEIFTNDKEANFYLDRPRRKPWELPVL